MRILDKELSGQAKRLVRYFTEHGTGAHNLRDVSRRTMIAMDDLMHVFRELERKGFYRAEGTKKQNIFKVKEV